MISGVKDGSYLACMLPHLRIQINSHRNFSIQPRTPCRLMLPLLLYCVFGRFDLL